MLGSTAWKVIHCSDTRLDSGQIQQWRRCQQPDSQLERIFYAGAIAQKEASSVRGEPARSECSIHAW
ncbi:hypothetical protein [Oscillatoria nigro-viridis]|uniref:hypothetical protein n=1 Tax=Phormidium nigroviride TaxID=482564 RepID=UPI0012372C83|nr:hypothetical protein [Oscillatoria nigro-viridis]